MMKGKLAVSLWLLGVGLVPAFAADTVSVDVYETPVRTVIEGLARSGGINLILDDTVQGNMTIHLKDVTVEEALQAIADSRNLLYYKNKSIRTMTAGTGAGEGGRRLHSFQLQYASPKDMSKAVQAMAPAAAVRCHEETNSLVLYGTNREAAEVGRLLQRLDRAPCQVKVAVEVASVDKEAMREWGTDWSWQPWQGGGGAAQAFWYQAQIHALESKGKARILARPHMMTTNGREARILIGDKIPVLTEHLVNGETTTTTEYTETGIKLTYTPRVHDDGSITAQVQAEVSTPVLVPEMKAYRITTRQAQTQVRMQNGQTLAIGGLIDKETVENFRKLPVLGDIPLLGKLFQSHYKSHKETEIVIFLQAQVVPPADAVAQA